MGAAAAEGFARPTESELAAALRALRSDGAEVASIGLKVAQYFFPDLKDVWEQLAAAFPDSLDDRIDRAYQRLALASTASARTRCLEDLRALQSTRAEQLAVSFIEGLPLDATKAHQDQERARRLLAGE